MGKKIISIIFIVGLCALLLIYSDKKNEKVLDSYALINEILSNPRPTINYLIQNKGSSSEKYVTVYSAFVFSQAIKSSRNKKNYLDNILEYGFDRTFSVDILSVSPDTTLALVTNLLDSGAYNFFSALYTIKFTDSNISVLLTDKIIDTSTSGISVIANQNKLGLDMDDIYINEFPIINAFFDYNDQTFNHSNMKMFGMYPCNTYYKYRYYKDRLILVSKLKARDCKKYNIEKPDDLPDNFDYTPEEIYKVTPEILEKAIKF